MAGVRPTRRCHRLTRKRTCGAARRDPSRAHCGSRQSGKQRRRLPRCLERARQQPGAAAGVRSRRPAVLRLRRAAAPHAERGTHDRVLRELPAMMRVTMVSYDDDPPLGGQGVVVHGMRAGAGAAWDAPCTRSRVVASTPSRSRGARAAHRSIFSLQLNRYPQILTRAAPDVVHAHGGPGGVLIWKRIGARSSTPRTTPTGRRTPAAR